MIKTLNITNGDCAVEIMKQANIAGQFLPWRDVLHEGPVPSHANFDELSTIRSDFISEQGWGDKQDIKNHFSQRDTLLQESLLCDEVILWFEHDLYDQLQLLQILDWYHHNRPLTIHLSMICVDQYLGHLTPEEMLGLLQFKKTITEKHFQLAHKSWNAFCSTTPKAWFNLLSWNTAELPFLQAAILRMLEEYPSTKNGLSRVEYQALKIIYQGEIQPGKIFKLYQETEEYMFLGDSSFWSILNNLITSSLLTLSSGHQLTIPINSQQKLYITTEGKKILRGLTGHQWLATSTIDRWIGGVHFRPNNIWFWDTASQSLLEHDFK